MKAFIGWVERHRTAGPIGGGPFGAFELPGPLGMTLRIVVSDGRDWSEAGLPGEPWEHVSVSTKKRTPTWKEMEYVREAFFKDDETALQFSVPRSAHINIHEHVLHLWRPTGWTPELPPRATA